MDVRDSTNITGISKLINYDGEETLDDLERGIVDDVNDGGINDVEQYKRQLEELGGALGVTLDDEESNDDNDNDDNRHSNSDDSDDSDDKHEPTSRSSHKSKPSSPRTHHNHSSTPPRKRDNSRSRNLPSLSSRETRVTEEEKRQKILNHVLSGVENQNFSIEKEKEEDDKAILLEQIDMLMTNLTDEGIDVSRVPKPIIGGDSPSTITEIANIHKILRLKNDRNRYCSFAEECILAASHALEWMFDGQKTYIGRRPDLRGWSATVNIKLRRMRYDTSTFVSGVMQDYNLGHGTRIAFELIPSLFLYSKMKKSQYADNLITCDEMNSAIDKIRDIDERK